MPIKNAKVYYDGSHYIAIPQENFSCGKHKKVSKKKNANTYIDTTKEQFESAYKESQNLPKRERKRYITDKLKDNFKTDKQTNEYVAEQLERKKINAIKRRVRLMRKVNLQEWNYFVTLTYDNSKHTEQTFEQKLRNTLKHLVQRKGWKYIGVFERSPDKERLHFHGIFYIPDNAMIGTLEQIKDYSTKSHRKQTAYQNTHFAKYFGRNDFKELCSKEIERSINYLLKYIEKSGERLMFGGKLPTYFKSDILDNDIMCPFGIENKKMLLADDFMCIDNGEIIGKVSLETISKMPKAY